MQNVALAERKRLIHEQKNDKNVTDHTKNFIS